MPSGGTNGLFSQKAAPFWFDRPGCGDRRCLAENDPPTDRRRLAHRLSLRAEDHSCRSRRGRVSFHADPDCFVLGAMRMPAHEEAPGRATGGNSNGNFAGINLGFQDTAQQRHQDGDCIYGRGVWLYREAGWRGVLPLPPAAKSPPPKGFTGYDGSWPTTAQVEEWVALRPSDSNLMLRVEHGVVGIDVDAYGSKTGAQTLKQAEARWGSLPPTFRSSARSEDRLSG